MVSNIANVRPHHPESPIKGNCTLRKGPPVKNPLPTPFFLLLFYPLLPLLMVHRNCPFPSRAPSSASIEISVVTLIRMYFLLRHGFFTPTCLSSGKEQLLGLGPTPQPDGKHQSPCCRGSTYCPLSSTHREKIQSDDARTPSSLRPFSPGRMKSGRALDCNVWVIARLLLIHPYDRIR